MSGFLTFILYIIFIAGFVSLGYCFANICCPAYNPEIEMTEILEELKKDEVELTED